MRVINTEKSIKTPLLFKTAKEFKAEENKGWSFSGVYSFEDIRNIYLLLLNHKFVSVEDFTFNVVEPNVVPVGKNWTVRRVREILNAVVNFKWFTRNKRGTEYKVVDSPVFSTDSLGLPISKEELKVFEKVFFSYSRFKEYLSLYSTGINKKDILESSTAVFSFSSNKYTDCFFKQLENNPNITYVDIRNDYGEKNSGFSSFWDVFVTWSMKLNLMEKFNSELFDMRLSNNRSFACSYFLSPFIELPDIYDILSIYYPQCRFIDLNDLLLTICIVYRKRIREVKDYIIEQYIKHRESFTLVRTSEIFINSSDKKEEDNVAYPKYKDSYVSHLIVR